MSGIREIQKMHTHRQSHNPVPISYDLVLRVGNSLTSKEEKEMKS